MYIKLKNIYMYTKYTCEIFLYEILTTLYNYVVLNIKILNALSFLDFDIFMVSC